MLMYSQDMSKTLLQQEAVELKMNPVVHKQAHGMHIYYSILVLGWNYWVQITKSLIRNDNCNSIKTK